MLLQGHCLSPSPSAGQSPASWSLLVSPGNAFSCSFPSLTSRRFLCLCAKSPPLYLSCTATAAGSLPVGGDGVFRMWFLRRRLNVVAAGASQRPEAAGGLRCQLHVCRASPPGEGLTPQWAGGRPPTATLPLLRATDPRVSWMLALSLLVLCLLMNQVSSHLDLSLG